MSSCGNNRLDSIVCMNGYVCMSVKENYNEWYEIWSNEVIDYISILKQMIDMKEGRGSCDLFNIDDVLHINDICTN